MICQCYVHTSKKLSTFGFIKGKKKKKLERLRCILEYISTNDDGLEVKEDGSIVCHSYRHPIYYDNPYFSSNIER